MPRLPWDTLDNPPMWSVVFPSYSSISRPIFSSHFWPMRNSIKSPITAVGAADIMRINQAEEFGFWPLLFCGLTRWHKVDDPGNLMPRS